MDDNTILHDSESPQADVVSRVVSVWLESGRHLEVVFAEVSFDDLPLVQPPQPQVTVKQLPDPLPQGQEAKPKLRDHP